MSLDTAEKQKLIKTHQVHSTDTGSVDVQVAMLSERISKLSDHLQGCLLYTSPSPRDQ